MKEKEFIKLVQNTVKAEYIGDDCAYLKDLGIVITQDNLVEDVHFSMKFTDARKLGYKSAMVNISDIAASGAEPAYLSVGLSLPKNTDENFIKDFYQGITDAAQGVKITGGDITGSDKIFISITAIGKTGGRKISSRKNAEPGYKIIVSGNHGSSAAGLKELYLGKKDKFTKIHLMPEAKIEFSKKIAANIKTDYAMTDTSDGLIDALMQIANASGVLMSVNFDKIPYDKDIEKFKDFKDLILYGGEDYELLACVPDDFYVEGAFEIGKVKSGSGVEIDGKILKESDTKFFNHFEEKK